MTASSKYQYGKRLGGGGMAEVFLAQAIGVEGFARQVAIKRVLPGYSDNAAFAAMFVNEARLSARLRHPNIVGTLDFDRDAEGRLFLVMELIDGKDLDGLLETGMLPHAVIIHVIVETLRGLGAAHAAVDDRGRPLGIVHRDVSPHNVLLSWGGGVKVSDFGIAKAVQASGAQQSNMLKGKASYMSPEQVNLLTDLDGRSDLFAVGVMLHEMLTGERLFKGASIQEVLTGVIKVAGGLERLRGPHEVRAGVPMDLATVTMGLLAVDRNQRYRTAEDAIDALQACSDASIRGQQLLARVMAERFPGQGDAKLAADAAQYVAEKDAKLAAIMAKTTRTLPVPRTPAAPMQSTQFDGAAGRAGVPPPTQMMNGTPPGYAAVNPAMTTSSTTKSRWPLVAGIAGAIAAAVVITVIAMGGNKKAEQPAAMTTSPSIDAAASIDAPIDTPIDASTNQAATPPPDAAPSPPDAAPPLSPPDARPHGGNTNTPRHPNGAGSGSGSGSGSGIQEIQLGGGTQ